MNSASATSPATTMIDRDVVRSGQLTKLIAYLSVCMLAAAFGALIGPVWSYWWALFGTFGLSSAIYSRDVNTTARAERDLQTGIVYVNASTIGAEIQLPFGGWRHSGSGHPEAGGRGGALDFYSRMKVVYRDFSGRLQKAQIDK